MKVESYAVYEEGRLSVYENERWQVEIKNWEVHSDLKEISYLERNEEADKIVVLLYGICTIIVGTENEGKLELEKTVMEPLRVYKIPQSVWHMTLTCRDTKLLLISDVSYHKNDYYYLSQDEIKQIQEV